MTEEERQMKAKAAFERFEKATSEIAAEDRFPQSVGMTEIELLEYSTRLQKDADNEKALRNGRA